MREYQIESYISYQSDISDHAREAIDHVDSPDDTLASDKIFSDPGDVTTYSDNCDSLARMHETHFGDSLSDIPRTVISSPPLHSLHNLLPVKGKTIFDCELGCFSGRISKKTEREAVHIR